MVNVVKATCEVCILLHIPGDPVDVMPTWSIDRSISSIDWHDRYYAYSTFNKDIIDSSIWSLECLEVSQFCITCLVVSVLYHMPGSVSSVFVTTRECCNMHMIPQVCACCTSSVCMLHHVIQSNSTYAPASVHVRDWMFIHTYSSVHVLVHTSNHTAVCTYAS